MADEPGKPSALVTEARKRWERCAQAESKQRAQIVEAKEFRAGNQWPDDIRIQRQGGAAIQGQAAQPPRPCLTIDRLSQPVRQISNQIKTANFAIDVLPDGSGADIDTAEIFKGLLRRIQNESRDESPIEWAADQAIEGGIGWFRLRTDYVYSSVDGVDGPELFDQEVKIERIVNNLTVYCDPGATKPTRSDARFMFVTEDVPRDEYTRRYPKSKAASLDFQTTGDEDTWITEDMVRIAEYWRIEDEVKVIPHPSGGKPRTVKQPRVKCDIINAVESLDTYEWVGSRIPLIPVMGEELNIDGRTVLRGVIDEGKDAQRMVNYMYSAAIETVALAPKSPFIVAEGQLEGYQALWQKANTANLAYLPYKPTTLAGLAVPPPMRDQAEPAIQAMVLMLAKSEDAIKATTGIWDPSLGNATPREKSGRAIQALQNQSDLGSSNYGDNVRRALIYAGEQIVEVLPKITRPGQVMTVLGLDDKPEQIVVGQAFEQGPDGRAIPKPEITPEMVKAQKGLAKFYDLEAGTYSVTVAVGKSFATRREEGRNALGELIPHLPPPMAAAVTPEFIETLDMPDAHKIAETARRALPPELRPPEDGKQPVPPEVQQQMAQMQQMLQMLTQELNAKNQLIETDGVKMQGKLQETQLSEQAQTQRDAMKVQSNERIHMLDNLVKLAIAEINAQNAAAEVHAEDARTKLGFQHEHEQNERDRMAQAGQADADRRQGAADAGAERSHESQEAERDRVAASQEAREGRAHETVENERGRQADAEAAEADRAMLGD